MAPAGIRQVDHGADTDDFSTQRLENSNRRLAAAAGGNQIVQQQHALARDDGIDVHLEASRAVLELVIVPDRLVRQLAGLSQRHEAGTEFFRHKRLGTDRAAIYAHEMAAIGAKTYREAAEPIIAADSADLTKWEHVMTVPMRFNRLILLRPWLWHAAGRSFGDSLANGRLVQLFFFGVAQAPGGPDQATSQSRSA